MNVLVVDDDKVDRITVRELLSDGFSIFEAESQLQAQELLNTHHVDCVLLDYLIPGTDSIGLLKEFAQQNLPVIMLTGEGNEHVAVSAMKHGAQDYINKRNLSTELLSRTVNNAVDTIALKRALNEKQAELVFTNDELKSKVAELERLNTDLENLIHMVAHDLREPLRNLSSFSDLLRNELGTGISLRSREYLDFLKGNARRLAALIDSVRALTRVVYAKIAPEQVDLNLLLNDILKEFAKPITDRSVVIKYRSLPVITGLPPLLKELLRNLIANALQYGAQEELVIEICADVQGSATTLTVRNNGEPIEEQHLNKVFIPFYRISTIRDERSPGMGLTLCRKIVERHGGRIWIESSPEMGVEVKCILTGSINGKG